jgi:hypothetical protein
MKREQVVSIVQASRERKDGYGGYRQAGLSPDKHTNVRLPLQSSRITIRLRIAYNTLSFQQKASEGDGPIVLLVFGGIKKRDGVGLGLFGDRCEEGRVLL